MRRHPLVDEAESNLDVAYARTRSAELKAMALEDEYNEALVGDPVSADSSGVEAFVERMAEKEARQDALALDHAYDELNAAVIRFSDVSTAFSAVAMVPEPSLAPQVLSRVLFRDAMGPGQRALVMRALKIFSGALRRYIDDDEPGNAEAEVRMAWGAIETYLDEAGRAR